MTSEQIATAARAVAHHHACKGTVLGDAVADAFRVFAEAIETARRLTDDE